MKDVFGESPETLWFRSTRWEAGTVFPLQCRPWGRLMYALKGTVEFTIADEHYLSTPAYAIWIPPETPHYSKTEQEIEYVAIHINRSLCSNLPSAPCTLKLSHLITAIMADLAARHVSHPLTSRDKNLCRVLIEQLEMAPRYNSFLPTTDDRLLKPILNALQEKPGDQRALRTWAEEFGMTERTLSRRFKKQMGITYHEWRIRLKLVAALSLLKEGKSVKYVAHELGYNNPSAFIAMFHQQMGVRPTQFSGQ